MVDIMSKEKRSALMSRIKSKNTKPEIAIRKALWDVGRRPRRHVGKLPGRPDFVFWKARVAVFVDGDFWHGWRFPEWEAKLQPFWQQKIEATRSRDQRNFRKLRGAGWKVIRIWEHQINKDIDGCIKRILQEVDGKDQNEEKGR